MSNNGGITKTVHSCGKMNLSRQSVDILQTGSTVLYCMLVQYICIFLNGYVWQCSSVCRYLDAIIDNGHLLSPIALCILSSIDDILSSIDDIYANPSTAAAIDLCNSSLGKEQKHTFDLRCGPSWRMIPVPCLLFSMEFILALSVATALTVLDLATAPTVLDLATDRDSCESVYERLFRELPFLLIDTV